MGNKVFSGSLCRKRFSAEAARNSFAFFFLFVCFQSFGQSYFYFENKIALPGAPAQTYYSFLNVEPNGNAVIRIRYADSETADNYLFELNLIDSLIADSARNSLTRYLVPEGEVKLIVGQTDTTLLKVRVVFRQQADSTGTFYLPVAFDVKKGNGSWFPAQMIKNTRQTYNELKANKEFVSIFFNEEDDFYSYLFTPRTRTNFGIRKEKLYLIVVANTLDSAIGKSSAKDFKTVTETFTTLAADAGIQNLIPIYISGNQFSKKAVDEALKSLQPAPIDIVVFYYSGHGFRYQEDVSKYPRMSFRTRENNFRDGNNLKIEEVYQAILQKKPRVTLVLSDCCNEDVGAVAPNGRDILTTRGRPERAVGNINYENMKALFFPPAPVSILIGSAEKNQLAAGNPNFGGFFTYYFTAELINNLYGIQTLKASWLRILLTTKEKASYQSLSALCGTTRCIQRAEISVNPPQ